MAGAALTSCMQLHQLLCLTDRKVHCISMCGCSEHSAVCMHHACSTKHTLSPACCCCCSMQHSMITQQQCMHIPNIPFEHESSFTRAAVPCNMYRLHGHAGSDRSAATAAAYLHSLLIVVVIAATRAIEGPGGWHLGPDHAHKADRGPRANSWLNTSTASRKGSTQAGAAACHD